jgi:hypothetical protein
VRTAVLTFHRCINYGSYWQARCLLDGLAARGHGVELIDHRSARVDRAEWRCALEPMLPDRSPACDRPQYARKARRFFEAFEALPRSAPVDLEQPQGIGAYDRVVIGSDEVWNLDHPWFGGCALFFGHGLGPAELVAYAASCGNYHAMRGLDDWRAEGLRRFHHLAVRDQNTRRLVQSHTGSAPSVVLDPCLQFGACEAADSAHSPPARRALVYGHHFTPWFAAEARRWARRRGVRLVSIGYRNDWADEQWLDAGPTEFDAAMRSACGVLTNFFHGCVFALRLHKPFMCEYSAYRSLKIQDLLADFSAGNHLAREGAPPEYFNDGMDQPLSPLIEARLALRRAMSEAFLDQALPPSPASHRPTARAAD